MNKLLLSLVAVVASVGTSLLAQGPGSELDHNALVNNGRMATPQNQPGNPNIQDQNAKLFQYISACLPDRNDLDTEVLLKDKKPGK